MLAIAPLGLRFSRYPKKIVRSYKTNEGNKQMSQRDGFGRGFVIGSIVGGVIGGVLGALLTNRSGQESVEEKFIELFIEVDPDKRSEAFNSLEEAISNYNEDF